MYFVRKRLQKAWLSSNFKLSLPVMVTFFTLGALLTVLIYYSFTKNPINTVAGLILFLVGIVMLFKDSITCGQKEFIGRNATTSILNTSEIVNFSDNYNLNIQGDSTFSSCQEHSMSKYITIQDRQVEIGDDISQTFNEFRDILMHSIAQSPNALEAISEFAKKLAEELHKYPELKVRLNSDRNVNEQELANNILKLLLTQNHYHQIQKLSAKSDLVYVEYINDDDELYDRQTVIYKGYKIHLHKDQNNRWHYKIQRNDLSLLTKNKSRRFFYREHALATAKRKIKKDKFNKWDFSTKLPG